MYFMTHIKYNFKFCAYEFLFMIEIQKYDF